jgi:signal transduction histidine kinase
LTFANVIGLSLLCCTVDAVRRHYMVDMPVKKITAAVERMMQGDLSVRIEKTKSIDPNDSFTTIIDYFNRMAVELSGMETLRTDFISNVSHELKTPLAVMQNYGTMLQQPNLPEKQRMEYAKAITERSRSLASMVSNILKLNKLENQTIYPATKTYDLSQQLGECLAGFEELWDEKNIEIEADLEENVYVKADPELLTLAWNNLISNAIKFTDPGGTVSLSLRTEGEAAVVEVADTGCGISPEVGRHIFEKFYQGDTSHAAKGNGLGLALVRRVIDITGGDISVSSRVGEGSTFTVKLRREGHETVHKVP